MSNDLFIMAVVTLHPSDSELLAAITKAARVSPQDQAMLKAEVAKYRSTLTGAQPFATILEIGENAVPHVIALIPGGSSAFGPVDTEFGPATEAEIERAREAGAAAGRRGVEECTDEWTALVVEITGTEYPACPRQKLLADELRKARIEAGELQRQAKASRYGRPPARFRHPVTGETWTGRGLRPRWVMDALEGGMTMEQIEVKQ